MNPAYVIAVITSLGCGVNVLCLRAIEHDATGQHTQTYPTPNECVAALNRLMAKAQHDATRQLDWRCQQRGKCGVTLRAQVRRPSLGMLAEGGALLRRMARLGPTNVSRETVHRHSSDTRREAKGIGLDQLAMRSARRCLNHAQTRAGGSMNYGRQAIEPAKYQAIDLAKDYALRRSTAQNIGLVAKNEDFDLQCHSRSE